MFYSSTFIALFRSIPLYLISVSLTFSSLCYQNIFACVRKIENMHTVSGSSMCQIERTILKSGLRAANEQRQLVHQKHFFLSVFHFFYFYYIRSFELFIIRTNIHCINKLFKLALQLRKTEGTDKRKTRKRTSQHTSNGGREVNSQTKTT